MDGGRFPEYGPGGDVVEEWGGSGLRGGSKYYQGERILPGGSEYYQGGDNITRGEGILRGGGNVTGGGWE